MIIRSNAPSGYSSKGSEFGSNEALYQNLISELKENEDEISKIRLALYLFNNVSLYEELVKFAETGISVNVTSIPLSGYDHRKISKAIEIYRRAIDDNEIQLSIYPHMYYWYGARYAGGNASYSFHVKAGLIKYRDGTSKVFISSGNFAPGDPTHSESLASITMSNTSPIIKLHTWFFDELLKRSKPFSSYHKYTSHLSQKEKPIFDFSFIGGSNITDLNRRQVENSFYTAPFITIEGQGSNHYSREKIVELITKSKKQLLICTQHSHDISPFDGYEGPTLIASVSQQNRKNPGLDIRILKQVSSSGLSDKRRASFVESHLHYAGIPQRSNRLIHDKFIISDDTVLITSGNFTATQFGWGDRKMEFTTSIQDYSQAESIIESACSYFGTDNEAVWIKRTRPRSGPGKVKVFKNDVFSEVNSYLIVENQETARKLTQYFYSLWNHQRSTEINIPI